MRTALSIGLLLLLLVFGLNVRFGSYRARGGADKRDAGAVTVQIYSAGGGLQPARFLNRRHWQGVFVDGRLYAPIGGAPGLRVALIPLDGGEVRFESLDVGASDADAAEFEELVRTAPVGTCLATGLLTTARPRDDGADERGARLAEVYALLGVQAPPLEGYSSWAFLAVRRPHGWVPLGEKASDLAGVCLSYQIVGDGSRYDDLPAPPVRGDALVTSLFDTLDQQADENVFAHPQFRVRGVELRSVQAFTPFGPSARGRAVFESRAIWPFVRIRPKTTFTVELGHLYPTWHDCSGVDFQVLVDGKLVATRRLDATDADVWQPWSVDLSGADRWARLELRVRPADQSDWSLRDRSEPTAWGDPSLVYGFEPLQAIGGRGEDIFDIDHDGVVTRANMSAAIWAFDADGNGEIEAAEVPPLIVRLMLRCDADGDGHASRAEVEAWISAFWRL